MIKSIGATYFDVTNLLREADYESLLQSVSLFALKFLCSRILIAKETGFDPAKGLLGLLGLKYVKNVKSVKKFHNAFKLFAKHT